MTIGGTTVTHHAETDARREDRLPVDLGQPIALSARNPNGDVTIRATDRTDVLVTHVTHGLPEDVDDDGLVTVEAHGNRIDVQVDPHAVGGWGGVDVDLDAVIGQITRAFRWGGSSSSPKLGKFRFPGHGVWCDLAIEVPRTMTGRVEATTASGDIRIEEVSAELALHTSSGDMRAVGTAGSLKLETASGDMTVEGARGWLRAQSASGDVRVFESALDGFHVQTASGDLAVDAALLGDADSRVQTASGDVRLTLRQHVAAGQEPAAALAFHTVSGDANVRSPFRKTERRRWQAGSGGAGPRIDVTTVSGDLHAELAPADPRFIPAASAPAAANGLAPMAPPPPPAAPAPPAPVNDAAPVGTGPAANDANAPASEPLLPAAEAPAEATPSPGLSAAERLAVLEAVERGDIDVEEALRRLEQGEALATPEAPPAGARDDA